MDMYNTNMNAYGYGQQNVPNNMQMNNQQYMNQQTITRQRTIDITDFVNGFNGAANYPIPMGRSGLLIDFSIGKFWIKSPGGPQPMEEFDFKRCEPVQKIQNDSITRDEFNSLRDSVDKMTEMLTAMQSNSQREPKYNNNNKKG